MSVVFQAGLVVFALVVFALELRLASRQSGWCLAPISEARARLLVPSDGPQKTEIPHVER
jgi:hypothetical protein